MPRLLVEEVVKVYRSGVRANAGIDLQADAGEILGVLGPNGAGKTTLVRQLLGLSKPTSGRIEIDGVDVVSNPAAAHDACSYQPQAELPMNGLRARRAIELLGRLRGGDARRMRARAHELLERFELGDIANRTMQDLSGGVTRIVAFCAAIIEPGAIVVLDEPTNDVDPLRRRVLWDAVREVAAGGSTVVVVTHNVHEADRVVDRLAIIDHGRVAAAGRPGELRRGQPAPLRFDATRTGELSVPSFLVEPRQLGARLSGGLTDDDVDAALTWCRARQHEGVIDGYTIGPVTLEDIYIDVIGRTA